MSNFFHYINLSIFTISINSHDDFISINSINLSFFKTVNTQHIFLAINALSIANRCLIILIDFLLFFINHFNEYFIEYFLRIFFLSISFNFIINHIYSKFFS